MSDSEKAIYELKKLKKYLPSTMWEQINDVFVLLKEREPVRCKDCRYGKQCENEDGKPYILCSHCFINVSNTINFTNGLPQDWFCADGKRRDGDD